MSECRDMGGRNNPNHRHGKHGTPVYRCLAKHEEQMPKSESPGVWVLGLLTLKPH